MISPSSISLPQFLTKWYGEPDKSAARVTSHPRVPPALMEWHALAAQWSRPLMAVKKFIPIGDITVHDGMNVFMTDPGDAIWAFDPTTPMAVYEGRMYEEWCKVPETFEEFLIHNALVEVAYNAPYKMSCDSVRNDRMVDVLAPMEEVAFGEWKWPAPGHRIFASETLIAHIGPALSDGGPLNISSAHSEVQIGAIDPTEASYLRNVPDTDWF
ncbi:hypothetical protein ACF07W_37550 [Streptomyces sp. NPDC015140]|uniref:hypothetical protein n=1 Tax=Streptomyces sp. NPDC015140 TaxID=3364943 RepID=UPI0036F8481E